jgi:hypothetical protein
LEGINPRRRRRAVPARMPTPLRGDALLWPLYRSALTEPARPGTAPGDASYFEVTLPDAGPRRALCRPEPCECVAGVSEEAAK